MNQEETFSSLFALEAAKPQTIGQTTDADFWKVMLVDDEPDIHAVMHLALKDIVVEGRTLQLFDADSAEEAKVLLAEHSDIALILLDVVMERENAGLELVRYIRDDLRNSIMQVVLVTGQPGYAPRPTVVVEYEINGYLLKSELTTDKIFFSVYAALHIHQVMGDMDRQRRQLAAQTKILLEKEEVLLRSQAELKAIYDHAPVMLCLVNEDRHVLYANPALTAFIGVSEDDLKGGNACGVFGCINALDDRRGCGFGSKCQVCALRLAMEDTFKTGASHKKVDYQATLIGAEADRVVSLSGSTTLIRSSGQKRLLLCLHDITERKQAEDLLRVSKERFRRLFAHNSATMLMIDPETGDIIEANRAAANFYGWSVAELKQMRIQQINTLAPEAVEKLMQETRSSGSLRLEFRHRRANGTIRDVEVFSSRIEISDKDFLYSIIHDISERKQAEEALKDSLAEKDVLLREVHHRVKNNMAAIIGLFNLHRQAMDDPQSQTVLSELSSRVRAMSLVHEKLYRSKSLAKIDFQDYIQSLISHLRTSFGSPGIKCDIQASGVEMPLDLAVPCGMIINELVINALKYAFLQKRPNPGEGGDRIEVAMSHDNGTFVLSIADNGVGFPAGFDLNTVKTLGLVLVKMLGQHQLGGRYEVDHRNGTRFTLTFSLRKRKTENG